MRYKKGSRCSNFRTQILRGSAKQNKLYYALADNVLHSNTRLYRSPLTTVELQPLSAFFSTSYQLSFTVNGPKEVPTFWTATASLLNSCKYTVSCVEYHLSVSERVGASIVQQLSLKRKYQESYGLDEIL